MAPRVVIAAMVARGGIEFRRRSDGAVEVWRPALPSERSPDEDGVKLVRVSVIPANEWASILASMSTYGEDGYSYNIALSFHTGGEDYDRFAHEHNDEGPRLPRAVRTSIKPVEARV